MVEAKLPSVEAKLPSVEEPETEDETIDELLESIKHNSYLSSPLPQEELIAPITIDDKTLNNFTLTPNKRHKRPKTHKTYKVYKKPKSSSTIRAAGIKKSKSKNKSKSKSRTRTSKLYSLF
jgi:hypothetical protein